MSTGSLLEDAALRHRMAEAYRRRREPTKPPYSPSIRPDQVRALYYLKRFEGRAMTKLLQEALDRYLEPHGGAQALVARGIAKFGDRGEEFH